MGKLGEEAGGAVGDAHKRCLVPPLLGLGGSVNQFPAFPAGSGRWLVFSILVLLSQ